MDSTSYEFIDDNKLINPGIPFPFFVLTSDLSSWLGYKIRSHTKNGYSHAMCMIDQGVLASQNWRMEKVSLSDYMTGSVRIKYWWSPKWTDVDRTLMMIQIQQDLQERGSYDWLGILGQQLGWLRLNFEKLHYCSEQCSGVLKKGDREYSSQYTTRMMKLINQKFDCDHPSPADLDRYFASRPEFYRAMVFDPTL